MPTLTLAEALAQIDVLRRRAEQKQRLIDAYLFREERRRDPLAAHGGTPAVLGRELWSLDRLRERHVLLRRLIQRAYERATLTVGDETRSVADWLVWKREVATRRGMFLDRLQSLIRRARENAGVNVVVHLDEQALARQAEAHPQALGQLEGLLTLKNATLTIDAPADDWATGLEERLEGLTETAPPPATGQWQPPWDSAALRAAALDPIRKIAAIKLYRERTGVGLAEAKQAVEAFASGAGG